MSARRAGSPRRPIDGVLLLDKPGGITSQGAVARAKALLGAAKVGHTGTLDPMATGLLPLAFGEATKFSHMLLDADKSYVATIRLGTTTTTGDMEGAELTRMPVDADPERVDAVLAQFRGEIEQIPPMFSALKHAGKPLYEYARAGTEVARTPRRVTILALRLADRKDDELAIEVTCTKGTYIRVLAEDIGAALGCGACLAALRRTRVDRFSVNDAIALDALMALQETERLARLLPVDSLVAVLPACELDREQARRIGSGQAVECSQPCEAGLTRIYGPGAVFLGVAEAHPGRLLPRRLVTPQPGYG